MITAARRAGRTRLRGDVISGERTGRGPSLGGGRGRQSLRLDNRVAVDRNPYEYHGATAKIMDVEPLVATWKSLGWQVLEIEVGQIAQAFEQPRNLQCCPTVIVANTIKGRGASFFIDRPELTTRFRRIEHSFRPRDGALEEKPPSK